MSMFKFFFEKLNFYFEQDIVQKEIIFSENAQLTGKIKNKIFFFSNKNTEQAKNSFYLITANLTSKEFLEIRRYIWNEDKFDFFFYPENSDTISLFYAKKSPDKEPLKIDTFKILNEDEKKIKKIKKWKFEKGTFWIEYSEFIDKVKKNERIDKKLVNQLKVLKNQLLSRLGNNSIKTVQALIDRTLFIKFLEDNHIINSFFYEHFFNNKELNYLRLLENKDAHNINLLYEKINEIFSNVLFTPAIDHEFLIKSADLIYNAIKQTDLETGQLSLFDFRFDIIPIEFISHIYEVFLENEQLDQGIYYTPPKLAQLIIDDTITKTGKILDPACGSGMFLILGFRKILSKNPINPNANISEKIEYKIKLLQKYVFGIEKENTAWRLTIFSLFLEVLKNLPSSEIKKYIENRIKNNEGIQIFPDFTNNIKEGNSLEVSETKKHFPNQNFDYIVGNPPFLQIESSAVENDFLNNYKTKIKNKEVRATDVVGYKQISQAFMLKIKDWANDDTKFGFVLNNSNFDNEKSEKFQQFFFENYQIENFYELSRVKKILFKKAKESVIVAIFNNEEPKNNTIKYYPVDLELFSETFKLLVIQEDKRIDIKQKDIIEKKVILRNFLIGNEFNLKLIEKLSEQRKLEEFLLKDKRLSFLGLSRISNEELALKLNISYEKFHKMTSKEKMNKHKEFALKNYLKEEQDRIYNTPYIYQPDNKIEAFKITSQDGFMKISDVSKNNFQRPRNIFNYQKDKIIFSKFGNKIEATYVNYDLIYSFLIFKIKLKNVNNYNLFTALINSNTVNYYLTLKFRKRIDDNFANLDTKAIKNIPIPKILDEKLVSEISEISKQLTEGKLKYEGETKEKLNELIYDLYDLDYLERQRIKDFFTDTKQKIDFEKYKETLFYTLEMYFKNKSIITHYQDKSFGFDLSVVAIYFNKKENEYPTAKKTLKYVISEDILKNTEENFLVLREKIITKDCIYIVKSNKFQNWSETKAYEDGKSILKLIGE